MVIDYLLHHLPDEHALVVVVLDLLVQGINHQLLGAVAMETLESEHIGQRNHVHVTTCVCVRVRVHHVCVRVYVGQPPKPQQRSGIVIYV